MNINFLKIMFFLALPWMFLITMIDSFIKRMRGRLYTEYDYEMMSGVYNWIMPIGAAFSTYLIVLVIYELVKVFI